MPTALASHGKRLPVEFTTIEVAGDGALRLLEEYRSTYRVTGQYPFLIGGDEELEHLEEGAEDREESTTDIIAASLAIDGAAWLAKKREQLGADGDDDPDVVGEWPGEAVDHGSILLHKDILTGKIKPEVYLGLATIEQPWQLPAVLRFGGWNDCPFPAVHCALHRSWQERFGAEITGMSGDVVECVVRNPPRDRKAALELAWEQFWYCTDIVDQGYGSISTLAAALLDSPYWYFWWD